MNSWTPNKHFRFPKVAPTESEENRLFSFNLRSAFVRSNPKRDSFPYPRNNLFSDFRHTLNQWKRIGESKGKGNRAMRRMKVINRAKGPWVNWPEMTITAV